MSLADYEYNGIIQEVLREGQWDTSDNVRPRWKDGNPAHTISIPAARMTFKPDEIPILTTKKVFEQTARSEIKWIWQDKSNVVQDLRDYSKKNKSVWDEWEIKEGIGKGTIGPAYGYQLRKQDREIAKTNEVINLLKSGYLNNAEDVYEDTLYLDQVDYLLYQLKVNPSSRRHVTTLWNVEDLDEMTLTPCVWSTQWVSKNGTLHLIVQQRSGDLFLGVPFNIYQYGVLHRQIAHVTNHKLGNMTFNINDAHIYDRHIEQAKQVLNLPIHPAPDYELNKEIKSFYDFKLEDFQLINYKHGPIITAEIAI